jgi:hypothetical protein
VSVTTTTRGTRVALGLLVTAAALAALADARTSAEPRSAVVNWVERENGAGPKMTFRIRDFKFAGGRWSTKLTMTNGDTRPVAFSPNGEGFRLEIFASARPQAKSKNYLFADRFVPRLPRTLNPRRTWTGVVSGADLPEVGDYIRLVIGPYGIASNMVPNGEWITDHVHRVRAK